MMVFVSLPFFAIIFSFFFLGGGHSWQEPDVPRNQGNVPMFIFGDDGMACTRIRQSGSRIQRVFGGLVALTFLLPEPRTIWTMDICLCFLLGLEVDLLGLEVDLFCWRLICFER